MSVEEQKEAGTEELVETRLELDKVSNFHHVTVFSDRAEVTRRLTFTPTATGTQALVLSGMASKVEKDSIRVKIVDKSTGTTATADKEAVPEKDAIGEEEAKHTGSPTTSQKMKKPSSPSKPETKTPLKQGKKEAKAAVIKPCTIVEVSFDVHHHASSHKSVSVRETKARDALKQAKEKKKEIKAEQARVEQQDELVQSYMCSMLTNSMHKGDAGPPPAGANLDVVGQLLAFHAKAGSETDAKLLALQQQYDQASEEEAAAESELSAMQYTTADVNITSRDVTIMLNFSVVAEVLLELTYLCTGASWNASYDMRVEGAGRADGDASMALTYFGVVKQSTGENWMKAPMSLSTASPARGGTPPLPPTKQVLPKTEWVKPTPTHRKVSRQNVAMARNSLMAPNHRAHMVIRQSSMNALEVEQDSDDDELSTVAAPSVATAKVAVGAASATFQIVTPATIASDNKEHKVTIAIIDISPTFRYFCTPALEEVAYLQARGSNSSAYPLLDSLEGVSIFMDGSFVTHTSFKYTSPGETFNIFLGVDPGIKVEHRLIKETAKQGEKPKGIFQNRQMSSHLREYRTLLHNTKASPIEITVVELFPRSSIEKITVELLQPPASQVRKTGEDGKAAAGEGQLVAGGVMMNSITNNVVFSRTLSPQQKLELPFSYLVTWPPDEGITDIEIV
eukprot:gb/GEZN01003163.1/.p1 GENE.gb/GEZN01003163.1/~~gb/GEZN01003163.1/.p1  ORF type:complete len:680 (+),score=118.60 gb/GEZN01003163.1/:29-2068(+)